MFYIEHFIYSLNSSLPYNWALSTSGLNFLYFRIFGGGSFVQFYIIFSLRRIPAPSHSLHLIGEGGLWRALTLTCPLTQEIMLRPKRNAVTYHCCELAPQGGRKGMGCVCVCTHAFPSKRRPNVKHSHSLSFCFKTELLSSGSTGTIRLSG